MKIMSENAGIGGNKTNCNAVELESFRLASGGIHQAFQLPPSFHRKVAKGYSTFIG